MVELLVKVEPGVIFGEIVVYELSLMYSNHPAAHAGAEEIYGVRAEPATEDPVKCCRHPASHDVSKDCRTGLKAGMRLNFARKLTDISYVLTERDDG